MRKVLSIYLPNFATELVRRRMRARAGARDADIQRAILLTREVHGRAIVMKRCEIAAAAGVSEGMCLTDARALLSDGSIHIEPHQPVRDAQRLQTLANACLRFAPLVQSDGADGLLLDVTGCGRIYGGQKRVVNKVASAIERLGFTVHAAIATSVGAAWAMSHFGPLFRETKANAAPARRRFIVPEERVVELLSPLPLAALRIDEDTQAALHEVAIDTIGDLLAIDRAELADRFDEALLRRVDQALGHAFEPIDPAAPEELPGVERRFAGPVKQLEAIELTVRGLLELLATDLHRSRLGVTRIEMNVERYDAPPLKDSVTLSRPSADGGHLWTLFAPRIERLNLGYGIEMIRLTAAQTQLLPHDQEVIWDDDPTRRASPTDEAMGQFVDRMISRLSAERVCRVNLIQTHTPEGAFVYEPWERETRNTKDETAVIAADRPSLLHRRPRGIDVVCLSPDGPVVSMRQGGKHHVIVTSIGPERIAGRWWLLHDPATAIPQRDYFKVQDEQGAWWWIYRESHTGRWFCHGQWA